MKNKKEGFFKFNSEKGAVSLFILIAVLFFTIILISVYVANMNKLDSQNQQISQIRENYDMSASYVNDLYKSKVEDITFLIKKENGKRVESTEWVNEKLIILVSYPNESDDDKNMISIDSGNTYIIYPKTGIIVTENTKIIAKSSNGKKGSLNIKNFDKEGPKIDLSPDGGTFSLSETEETRTLTSHVSSIDNESGVKSILYGWSKSATNEPLEWENTENNQDIKKDSLSPGEYYLWIKATDNLNNSNIKVSKFKINAPVCRIGATKYLTIQSAVDACSKDGSSTKIEMLRDTANFNNFIVPESANIILDLSGFKISGNGVIGVNKGILNIIDTSKTNTGTIESDDSFALDNNMSATLILGENNGVINTNSPKIMGTTYAITNNGIFNFFDGVIIGNTAVNGAISTIPEKYSAISKRYGETQERVYLGILAESVAKIGRFYYSTLKEAIADCPENAGDAQTKIEILRGVSLTVKEEIPYSKNIVLDLEGNTITNTSNDYVLENNAKLEIIDSSDAQTGVINGVNDSAILNNYASYLKINGGTITTSSKNALTNEGISDFINGKITNTASSGTAVYNYGEFNQKGGEINSTNISVYNDSKEIIYTSSKEDNYTNAELKKSEKVKYNFQNINGKITPSNIGIPNSTADSYIEIDLSNKDGKYVLYANAEISSQSGGDYGYAYVSDTTDIKESNTTGNFIRISGTVAAKDYTINLTGGKRYYLHFGYYKNESVDTGNDKIIFNDVNIYKLNILDSIKLDKPTNNGTYYFTDDNGKYIPNNVGVHNSVANSYYEIDLTDKENIIYDININAEISSENNYDFGYATITQSKIAPLFSDTNGQLYLELLQQKIIHIRCKEGKSIIYI